MSKKYQIFGKYKSSDNIFCPFCITISNPKNGFSAEALLHLRRLKLNATKVLIDKVKKV